MSQYVHGRIAGFALRLTDLPCLGLSSDRMGHIRSRVGVVLHRFEPAIIGDVEPAHQGSSEQATGKPGIRGQQLVAVEAQHHRPVHRIELAADCRRVAGHPAEIHPGHDRPGRREGIGQQFHRIAARFIHRPPEAGDHLVHQCGLETQPSRDAGIVGKQAEQMEAAAIGVPGPRLEVGVRQAAVEFGIEGPDVSAHALERESERFRRLLGVIREIQKHRIQEIGRILRPVESQAVKVRIIANQVVNQGMLVGKDVRARQTPVLREPFFGNLAVRQPSAVLLHGASELNPVARRDRGLNLAVHAEAPALGRGDEVVDQMSLSPGQIRRGHRPVTQAAVEGQVRFETGSSPDIDFPFAEERAVQQPHRTGVRVRRRLPLARLRVGFLHQIWRSRDGVGSNAGQVAQHAIDSFALDVLREDRDSEKLAVCHRACSISVRTSRVPGLGAGPTIDRRAVRRNLRRAALSPPAACPIREFSQPCRSFRGLVAQTQTARNEPDGRDGLIVRKTRWPSGRCLRYRARPHHA